MFCKNCGEPLADNQAVCVKCGVKTGDGNQFCQNCGKPVAPNADVCLACGVSVAQKPKAGDLNGKDQTAMGLIALFLGGFGIHNFIFGETKKGILKIVLSFCFGIGFILAVIDAVRIFSGSYTVDPEKCF